MAWGVQEKGRTMLKRKVSIIAVIAINFFIHVSMLNVEAQEVSIHTPENEDVIIDKIANTSPKASLDVVYVEEFSYNKDMELTADQLIEKYRDYSIEDIRIEYEELGKDPSQVDALIQICPRLTYEWKFTDEEMELFQRMVYAESGNQDEKTQKIVASVILNRMTSEFFPDTLEEVCLQEGQFEVVANGDYIRKTPNDNTKRLVEEVCQYGITTDSDVLFFRNYYYHEGYTDAFISGVLYFSKI